MASKSRPHSKAFPTKESQPEATAPPLVLTATASHPIPSRIPPAIRPRNQGATAASPWGALPLLAGLLFLAVVVAPVRLQAQTSGGAVGSTSQQPEVGNYKLSPNDLLDFRVFGEPDLDSVVRVAGDGKAIFPLIGAVSVGNHTVGEATEMVAARLRDGYLVSPQVSITVRGYAKKLFTVLGEVQKPGAYDMEGLEEITLLQAIGMAGGYTKIANPGDVTVKRTTGGRQEILRFNAKKMAHGTDNASFMIHAGDVITVAESLF